MKFTVRPHPKSLASMTTKAQEDVELSSSFGLDLKLKMWPGGNTVEPTPAPTTQPLIPTPQPSASVSPAPNIPDTSNDHAADELKTNPVELTHGHMDLRLRADSSSPTKYSLVLKDDSLTGEKTSVMRSIDSVTWKVGVNARFTRPQSLTDPSYDVLGTIGESSYVLPETQNPDIVWPGVSTEGIDYSVFPKGIDYEVRVLESPKDSRVAFFQTGTFGGPAQVMIDSANPALSRIHTDSPTHMHANWVFSRPGRYRLQIRALDGDKEIAAPVSWIASIHEAAAKPEPSSPSTALPSEQPTLAPTPSVSASAVPTVPTPAASSNPVPEAPTATPAPEPSQAPGDSPASSPAAQNPPAPGTSTVASSNAAPSRSASPLGRVSAVERLTGGQVFGSSSSAQSATSADTSPAGEHKEEASTSPSDGAQETPEANPIALAADSPAAPSRSPLSRWWWIPVAAGAIALGAGTAVVIRRMR